MWRRDHLKCVKKRRGRDFPKKPGVIGTLIIGARRKQKVFEGAERKNMLDLKNKKKQVV